MTVNTHVLAAVGALAQGESRKRISLFHVVESTSVDNVAIAGLGLDKLLLVFGFSHGGLARGGANALSAPMALEHIHGLVGQGRRATRRVVAGTLPHPVLLGAVVLVSATARDVLVVVVSKVLFVGGHAALLLDCVLQIVDDLVLGPALHLEGRDAALGLEQRRVEVFVVLLEGADLLLEGLLVAPLVVNLPVELLDFLLTQRE